ncbi:MAG: GntR family transcriptional regulator [Shinella sp.]|nr:GntR family transcriptional regulator [Shinella sp.]
MSNQVYEEIRRVIMGGVLQPGSNVSIRALADQLGTSMMPVRDALKRLISERILEMDGPRRLRLRTLSQSEFKEILALRENLEASLVGRAASIVSQADIDRLAAIQDRIEQSIKNSENFLDLNYEFHFTLYGFANRPVTVILVEALWLQVGPFLNYYRLRNGGPIAVNHHRSLIEALRGRNSRDAKAAILADIRDAAKVIFDEVSTWRETK